MNIATIEQMGNMYYVFFRGTVVGIFENHVDAMRHASDINLVF